MFKRALLCILILTAATAEGAPRKRRVRRPAPQEEFIASVRARYDVFVYAQNRKVADSSINPYNSILKLPYQSATLDFRPEYRILTFKKHVMFTVRPRLMAVYNKTETGADQKKENDTDADVDLTDGYAEFLYSRSLRYTAGLEVYQWGPAELYNASNPFFHLRTDGRNAFFKEKGEVLFRIAKDWSSGFNTMLIANPMSNNRPSWRYEEEFKPSAMVKAEISAENSANYLGFAGGIQPDQRPFIGEYFNYGWESGVSVYLDARHAKGRDRFQPEENIVSNIVMTEEKDDSKIATVGIAGIRWEGPLDIRLEYFYNSEGLNRDEMKLAVQSVQAISPYIVTNMERLLRPGLELYGQNILYLSVRLQDFGAKADSSLFFRTLYSLQDKSKALQVAYESPLSDAIVMYLEGSLELGAKDSEFTMAERNQVMGGVKWTL